MIECYRYVVFREIARILAYLRPLNGVKITSSASDIEFEFELPRLLMNMEMMFIGCFCIEF